MKTPLTWPVCLLIIAVFGAVRLNHQARTVTGKTENLNGIRQREFFGVKP